MSNNYPYRQLPSDSDLRPESRRYGPGADRDFYRQPQEPFSSSYLPSSSSSFSRSSAALPSAHGSQESVLSLLNSCGLEPEDLSMLAKLPEDVLTVETLPQILNQIKGRKGSVPPFPPRTPPENIDSFQHFTANIGTVKPLASRAPSPPPSSSFMSLSSAHWPSSNPVTREREQLFRQPIQHPPHLFSSTTESHDPALDRWAGHKTTSSVRSPPSSSSLPFRHTADQDHRPRPTRYGKEGSFSMAGSVDRTRPSRFSTPGSAGYRSAPPPFDERRRDFRPALSGRASAPDPMPSKKQALDFHGTSPPEFPYSCSLCDITVLSEKAWIQHVNTTGHADGQLNLLQQFPKWDCRLDGVGRDDNQSNQRKDGARRSPTTPRSNPSRDPQKQQKASDKGKVVCAKFAPQAVDEARLRKLIEPFGKVEKILMFPSLAFVEMGSCDQAKELVKFYSSSEKTARKEKIEFSISNTFSFLQSSQVVSFTPAPTGKDGRSDLICIAKRFGEPLYTLFLPSQAFVEMKLSAEAQKLVNYYSSSTLRLNDDIIHVAFSSEYRTLMRVPSAQKYEDESVKSKESNRDQRSRERTRTRSRSRSRGRRTKRSSSRDRKRRETRTQSRDKSRERSSSGATGQNQSEEPKNSVSAEEPQKEEGVSTNTEAAAAKEEEPTGDEERSTADESDIEGMEVIAEDGENVRDEDDLESQEEENQEKNKCPEADEAKLEIMEAKAEKPELQGAEPVDPEEDMEAEFPLDLENCITLDELKSDDEDEVLPDGDAEEASESSRVLFFSAMPPQYTDTEFISLMRGFGPVVRYLLIQNRQQGFVEMSTSSEALKAAEELQSKPPYLSGTRLIGTLSEKFSILTNGWPVPEEESEDKRSSSEPSKDDDSQPENTRSRKAPEQEPAKRSPELEPQTSENLKSPKATEISEKTQEKILPTTSSVRKTRSPEKQAPGKSSEDESTQKESRKNPDTNAEKRKGPLDNNAVPSKTCRTEEAAGEEETEGRTEPKATGEKTPEIKTEENKTSYPEGPESSEQESRLKEAAAPAERPAKPVGAEFVRPVVGYFCNLCQMIFSDEDEAKLQHCSTPAHYRKYQEKTGKDPWMS